MADEQELDLEAFFIQSIPSLYRQAERNLHSDDINNLECMERRLDDHIYVIGSVIQHCQQNQVCEDVIQLLLRVYNEVNFVFQQYQHLCFVRRDFNSELGFVCPVEQSQRPGRPRFHIPEEAIKNLHDIHGVWSVVASETGVSYKILLRRRHQYSLSVAQTAGPRNTFSDISFEELCEVVREILQLVPNVGETYVIGALRSRGIYVQRWRIRDAINAVDPISRALRRRRAVVRRTYSVPCPNALW